MAAGRIIGDYRRVALYGVARLIKHKEQEKAALDAAMSTEDVIRDREELSEQIRALNELQAMAKSYGFDISGPARTAREAVQWLYFGYLAAVKEQNGAAMSLGRTSTFLDIYFERDLAEGTLTEEQAQEIIDDFVIKLRIVRFLRTPEYDDLFAGDPTWVTESIGGMGDDGRSLVTKTSFRFLHTLHNLGPAPEPNLTIWYSPRLPDNFRKYAAKVAIETSALQFESDSLMRGAWGDDGAIACCVSPMLVGKQMQFFGARANLAKCLLYAINGGRDEITGKQVGPAVDPVKGDYLDFDDVAGEVRADDGMAGGRVCERDERHPLHARQVFLRTHRDGAARLRAGADDGVRHRGPLGGRGQPVGHPPRPREGDSRRDGAGGGLPDRGRFPEVRQQRQPRGSTRGDRGVDVHEQAAEASHVSQRDPHPVGADHHVERRLREEHRPHAGRTPQGRAVRARSQSDARPRLARHHGLRRLRDEDSVSRRRGRHFAHDHDGARKGWAARPANRWKTWWALLDAFFGASGYHMNVNVLNRATLLDAMDHPEKYPQLTIRVSGYAVNFVRLTREQQMDVINRTFHGASDHHEP